MKNKLIIGFICVLIVLVVGYFLNSTKKFSQEIVVSNFDECVAAGYPILESYPEQCKTDSGESFTRDIGNELEMRNEIMVSQPRPNQKISSPLKISGQAVGSWFWEATFQIDLYDADGKALGHGYASATTEWMTEEFVPFSGEVVFKTPSGSRGKLVLQKANPSGLEENGGELVIPVKFTD